MCWYKVAVSNHWLGKMLGTSRPLPHASERSWWKVLISPFKSTAATQRSCALHNEGKVRRVYARLKPPENSDTDSAKIECNSLQGRHLWHFLFAKPCRYSSMTGSLSGALFWVPAFILLIISSLSRSLKCSTRPGSFKFCQYIFTYFPKTSWCLHDSFTFPIL